MNETFIILTVLTGLIGLSGLFTAAEFASAAARRDDVAQLADQDRGLARMLLALWTTPRLRGRLLLVSRLGVLVTTLLLGWSAYLLATAVTPAVVDRLQMLPQIALTLPGDAVAGIVGLGIVLIVLLGVLVGLSLFGELLPKSIAMEHPNETAMLAFLPMRAVWMVSRPFIWLLQTAVSTLLRLLPTVNDRHHVETTEDLELLVTESHEQGMLDDQARLMLRNTLRLRDLVARHVMVHRTKLVAAPIDSSVAQILEAAIDAGFTRIPLYETYVDEIVGFVHVKDLYRLHLQKSEDISAIMREVLFVPETMPVLDVWDRLNQRRKYLAIVFDEFGGTAGLVTFEDLIEEVFGELQDEFDDEMALVSLDKEGRIHLRGDLLVADVNEYLDLNLPEAIADTLGGLIFSELGAPPQVGNVVEIAGVPLRVELVEDLGVQEVSLAPKNVKTMATFSEWEVADYDG